jgi:Domain of unknown function (DUF5916)
MIRRVIRLRMSWHVEARRSWLAKVAWLVTGGLLLASVARAGQTPAPLASPPAIAPAASPDLPFAIDAPPPPVPPEVISRDESGRATIRAVYLTMPIRIDGVLDEALYSDVPAISDFIQVEPQEGAPATEKTEFWLTFDRDAVYVSFRCWESEPTRVVANDMRRDGNSLWQGNDVVGFLFDTFYDRRNAIQFIVNPIGGRSDGQVTNERQWNGDWNPIWDVKTGRFEGGWTVEAALPFKSLRYRPGREQIWGFNAVRANRWKNELSFITRIPNALGMRGLNQASLAATVVGLEAPPGSRNLEIKPYAISDVSSDRTVTPKVSNDVSGDFGFDAKYGLTQNLTTDFTYNTDFAQVEADEQQVNLTRFSLYFPEKREFFLENQGTFNFGGVNTGGSMASSDTPLLFYSRRIGLNGAHVVPIDMGGRLTGRLGRYSLGVLSMRADDEPAAGARATTFSVVRLKRDLLRRSSVGLLFTGRSVGQSGTGTNQAFGVDGTFAFFDNLAINTYWARTRTDGLTGDDTSHRAQLDYAGDRYGVQVEQLAIGSHFNPEVGFLRRRDMRRSFGLFRFSPRPRSFKAIRKFSWTGSGEYIENGAGRLETRALLGEFAIEFQNSDRFSVSYGDTYEFLVRPFLINPGVTIPIGAYDFAGLTVGFNLAQQRTLSGNFLAEYGSFYSGHKMAFSVSRGRMKITPQLSAEPTFSINRVDLLEGSFTAHLLGSRVTYTMTPLMFANALVQYNSASHAVMANVRLRWEYRPGSELFVVYNEERDTSARRFPNLANRAFIIKVNRLFRF